MCCKGEGAYGRVSCGDEVREWGGDEVEEATGDEGGSGDGGCAVPSSVTQVPQVGCVSSGSTWGDSSKSRCSATS